MPHDISLIATVATALGLASWPSGVAGARQCPSIGTGVASGTGFVVAPT